MRRLLLLGCQLHPWQRQTLAKNHRFKLEYAPHFNMLKHSANDDLIDQLKFATDQTFTAW